MAIERLIYECSKNGIEKDTSGGQIYSYTQGMKKYLEDPDIGVDRLENYEQPVDFESDPEKNLAPMSFTYNQMETLFPKQFRYQVYKRTNDKIFGMSNNCVSLDWDNYKDYNTYLQMRGDGNGVVPGRGGAHEFCVFAGDYEEVTEYPICYYLSESLKNPYTPEDFCSGVKPGYMQPLISLETGDEITLDSVREFISEERERSDLLKKMAYALLHYKADSNRNYDRNVVICDEKENIGYWIGAVTMLFSKKIAKEISFSTYEYNPIGSEFRICGAFPVGTEYDPNSQNRGSYVFDCWNVKYEDIDFQESKSFYDFLIVSFLYQERNLIEFYDFVDKFRLDEIGLNLEDYYNLYEIIMGEERKKLSPQNAELLIRSVKDCIDVRLLERIFVIIINYYVGLNDDVAENYESILRNVMEEKRKIIEPLQNRCAYSLVNMLKVDSHMNVQEIKIVYQRYQKLFGYAGLDFANAFYVNLVSQADTVIANNVNYSYNTYFGSVIVNHVICEGRDYDRFEPQFEEGKWLRCVVVNILSMNLDEKKILHIVQPILEQMKTDPKGYIALLIAMEGMVRDYNGMTAQLWIRVSEKLLNEYATNHIKGYISIYEILLILRCEERVYQNLMVRSKESSDFEKLLNDITWLLQNYNRNFQAYREKILDILIENAEKSQNAGVSLQKILQICNRESDEKIYYSLMLKIIDALDIGRDTIDSKLLQDMEMFYQKKQLPLDDKLKIFKLLKEIQEDCEQGKKKLISKYGKGTLNKEEKYRLPKMSEQQRVIFLKRYAGYIAEIYVACGNLKVIRYFNNLVELDMFSSKELIDIEISNIAKKAKGDLELIAALIGFSVSLQLMMDEQKLADILTEEHVNTSKLNKYIQEKNREIMEHVKVNYPKGFDIRKGAINLKNYWEHVYRIILEKDEGIVKRLMKSSFSLFKH